MTADMIDAVDTAAPTVAIVILAAGRSTRMSTVGGHKLLATFDGVPLVRRIALRAIDSRAQTVCVVTGFRKKDVESCLTGLSLTMAHNQDYMSGMASSLVTGLRIPGIMDYAGVLVLLADMPAITTVNLDALIAAFEAAIGRSVVRACHDKVPGNPVILPRALYAQALTLQADRGAKGLIEASGLDIIEVEIGSAALLDVDTLPDLQEQGGVAEQKPFPGGV